jgi:hypothetical protein
MNAWRGTRAAHAAVHWQVTARLEQRLRSTTPGQSERPEPERGGGNEDGQGFPELVEAGHHDRAFVQLDDQIAGE